MYLFLLSFTLIKGLERWVKFGQVERYIETKSNQDTGSLRHDVLSPSPANFPTSTSNCRFLSATVLDRSSYKVAIRLGKNKRCQYKMMEHTEIEEHRLGGNESKR